MIEGPISDLKLDALGVAARRCSTASGRRCASRPRHGITRRVLRRRLLPRRSRLLRRGLRAAGRGGRAGGRRRRHARDRGARGCRVSSSADRRPVGPDVPVHFHGHDDFGLATAASSPPSRPARPGSRARSTAWASAPATRISARSRSRSRRSTAIRPARPRPQSDAVAPASPSRRLRRWRRGRRSSASTSSGASRAPSPRSSTTRPRSSRTPRSSSAPSAESCSARRAGSTRSGSRPSELGLDVPTERQAELLAAVKELGTEQRGLVSDEQLLALVQGG